ncbi:MAG: hypothetical protein M9894_20030 [Planctomycetes bacterium]|nr:hypothetical protein [Planctomycetota bacterium]
MLLLSVPRPGATVDPLVPVAHASIAGAVAGLLAVAVGVDRRMFWYDLWADPSYLDLRALGLCAVPPLVCAALRIGRPPPPSGPALSRRDLIVAAAEGLWLGVAALAVAWPHREVCAAAWPPLGEDPRALLASLVAGAFLVGLGSRPGGVLRRRLDEASCALAGSVAAILGAMALDPLTYRAIAQALRL